MMKKCPFCGANIEESARFCLYCMKPLVDKEQILPRKTNKSKWLSIFVAVTVTLMALPVVCLGLYHAFDNRALSDNSIFETAHTPADAVIEQYIDSTCTQEGSYDEVIYCSICGDEINRTQKTIKKKVHEYTQRAHAAEYLKSEANCTESAIYYYSCLCGEKGTETFTSGVALEHTFDQRSTASKYCKSPATCTQSAIYYYSCSCGESGTETFKSGGVLEHTFDQRSTASKYCKSPATCTQSAVYYYSCSCGEKGATTFKSGDTLDHTFNQKNVDLTYRKSAASCTAAAEYYYSCACGEKGITTFTIGGILEHSFDQMNTALLYRKSAATCTNAAVYYHSCVCGEKGVTTFTSGGVLEHTFDQKNTELSYCKSVATCTQPAAYYYSCVCGETGSSTFTSGGTLEHSFDQKNTALLYCKSAASCTEYAVYYYSCICGEKGAGTFIYGDLSEHVFDQKVTATRYKISSATCTELAVYCFSCACGAMGEETFRYGYLEEHVFNQTNTDIKYRIRPATCTELAMYYYSCSCGEKGMDTFTYGYYSEHVHDQKNTSTEFMVSNATETSPAVYYFSCICGDRGTYTFVSGDVLPHTHRFDQINYDLAYLKSSASCYEPAKYYYSCLCGEKGSNTFTSGDLIPHSFGDWIVDTVATCVETGERHHVCSQCQKSESESYTDTNAHSYDIAWTVDETHHWHKCLNTGCSSATLVTHHNVVEGFCVDCCLKIDNCEAYTRDGNYIYFGEFPQSLKSDDVTITSNRDVRGYYIGSDGCFYEKLLASPRSLSYSFKSGVSVSRAYYYFKVEPIRWRILKEDGGAAIILCDSILINKPFNKAENNNYENSTVRVWLNNQFYNIAFDGFQKALINIFLVDNSIASMDPSSAYNTSSRNTNDKIFLLSYQDFVNADYGFSSNASTFDAKRCMTVSDYAIAKGSYMSTATRTGIWWLRSPCTSYYNGTCALLIGENGTQNQHTTVDGESFGIVPALQIRLNDSGYNTDTTGLVYKANDDGTTCTIAGIGSYDHTEVIIPGVIDGMRVTSIADGAFWTETFTKITIPDSVTRIGDYAFYDCSSLLDITFGQNSQLTIIGEGAFYRCNSLESFVIPDSVKKIGDYAFSGCYEYYAVSTNWGPEWYLRFDSCNNLTSITLGENSQLESIGKNAFYNHYADVYMSLTSVYISNLSAWCRISFGNYYANPLYCAKHLYLDGQLVTDLIIPDDVTSIGSNVFLNCTSIVSITIPESVRSIDYGAFYRCANLKFILVDSENRDYYSDGNCLIHTESQTIVVGCQNSIIPQDGSVTSIGDYAFYNCDGLTYIVIPDAVTRIGYAAFYDCDNLASVTFGENSELVSIGDFAFDSCGQLTNITLGKNSKLLSIGISAFESCTKLTTVYFGGTIQQWQNVDKGEYWNNDKTTIAIICTDGTTIEKSEGYVFNSATSIKLP